MSIYCTTFCNSGHRLTDGKPVDHECYVLPPAALEAERKNDFESAWAIIEAVRPLRPHRGVKIAVP